MKSEIQIKNSAGVCRIEIEGTIGVPEEWQFDQPEARVATYEKFRDTVRRIAGIDAPQIVVDIRSTGGDVNDALLIHDALRSLDAHITTRCYGYTASAATIIAQAASPGCREISANALYLIHTAICAAEGNAAEIAGKLDLLRQTDTRIAAVYAARSGRPAGEFEALMAEKVPLYERRFGVHYDIAFSEQKPSTDTVAVNPDNTLFRTDAGALLFRPAGHGALIENLNEIDADLVFVKNIDNVTTDARRGDTVTYKKVLAGLLLELQERSFEYIRALDTGGAELADIARFIRERLCVKLPDDYNSAVLRAVLDRPIRLCGMVRNEGEPGGGPFWAVNDDGTESLQCSGPPTSIRSIWSAACAT